MTRRIFILKYPCENCKRVSTNEMPTSLFFDGKGYYTFCSHCRIIKRWEGKDLIELKKFFDAEKIPFPSTKN